MLSKTSRDTGVLIFDFEFVVPSGSFSGEFCDVIGSVEGSDGVSRLGEASIVLFEE